MANPDLLNSIGEPLKIDLRQSMSPRLMRRGFIFAWLRVISLILSDTIALVAAWVISQSVFDSSFSLDVVYQSSHDLPIILGVAYSVFAAKGVYQSGVSRKDYPGIIKSATLVLMVLLLLQYWALPMLNISSKQFLVFWLFSLLLLCICRFLVEIVVSKIRGAGIAQYPVCLIADPESRQQAIDIINGEGHYNIVSTLTARALDREERESTFESLQGQGIVEVFVDWEAVKRRLFLCKRFQSAGFTIRVLTSEELPPPSTLYYSSLGGRLCMSCIPPLFSGIEFLIKRLFDIVLATIGLLLISPILLGISALIYIDSPGPIFYKQTRIGLKNKPFKVWKFRTMVPNADKLQKELEVKNETKDGVLFKIKDDPRITRVGRFLRQYSLDELPQLINVILGEMSLVGPRPLPLRDVEKFSQHHHIRQEVLPGVTGLWQVSGRSDIIDFDYAYQLDLFYITNWSIWLDIQIIFRTFGVVLRKSGAY